MWRWMTRFRGWLMAEMSQRLAPRPAGQSVHLRYEKAGLSVPGPPIPINAEMLGIELLARLPPSARLRTEFFLRIPGQELICAERVSHAGPKPNDYRILFRSPVPYRSVEAEILWKQRLLTTTQIDIQTEDEFRAALQIQHPTVSVRLGDQSLAASTFIAQQCRSLSTMALLRSPTRLMTLADLGVTVRFLVERTGQETIVSVPLTGQQLLAKEALVQAAMPKVPRQLGAIRVSWHVGSHECWTHTVQGIGVRQFLKGLRVSDARLVTLTANGTMNVVRHGPLDNDVTQVGPCFVLASQEDAIAGMIPLQIVATMPHAGDPQPVVLEQERLIGDGLTIFAPGLLDVADLNHVTGFELRHQNRTLGSMSISPIPAAKFNSEGGFSPPANFNWSPLAEDELAHRLGKLMGE